MTTYLWQEPKKMPAGNEKNTEEGWERDRKQTGLHFCPEGPLLGIRILHLPS